MGVTYTVNSWQCNNKTILCQEYTRIRIPKRTWLVERKKSAKRKSTGGNKQGNQIIVGKSMER